MEYIREKHMFLNIKLNNNSTITQATTKIPILRRSIF